ncbi:copper transporter [Nocardioides mesophilus]|uniref:Copper transporter n=1 Tax=Nocardioides mesophilus TaxID=433659 RepID=A0A7G9RAJ5_9ACTN|nr:copper transporter [Nocardioides mesophilus]QNN52620.1 copper transporter [Nocardioides mesophilus]
MISFRYHIVSIVSVFLALAVGVALGGGPLKGEVDNTLVDQVQADREVKAQLQQEITSLKEANAFADDFAAAVAPGLIGDTLKGRSVTLVALPTASQSEVTQLSDMVSAAGGSVAGTVRFGEKLLDVDQKQLVDELGSQLLAGASGVSVPPDASGYERAGALIARAIGTQDAPDGAEVDGAAESILAGLSTAELISVEGDLTKRGSLVLFVAGPGEGTLDQRQGSNSIATTLISAVDANTDGTVVAGPLQSARPGGLVRAVRDDVAAAEEVSTVDVLGREAGRIVAVMALVGQSNGQTGHYGAVDAADGALPGATGGE